MMDDEPQRPAGEQHRMQEPNPEEHDRVVKLFEAYLRGGEGAMRKSEASFGIGRWNRLE